MYKELFSSTPDPSSQEEGNTGKDCPFLERGMQCLFYL